MQKEPQVPSRVVPSRKGESAWSLGQRDREPPRPSRPPRQRVKEAGLAGKPLSLIPDESEPRPRDLNTSPEAGDLGYRKEAPGSGGWGSGWGSGAWEFPGRGPAEAGHADEPPAQSVP